MHTFFEKDHQCGAGKALTMLNKMHHESTFVAEESGEDSRTLCQL